MPKKREEHGNCDLPEAAARVAPERVEQVARALEDRIEFFARAAACREPRGVDLDYAGEFRVTRGERLSRPGVAYSIRGRHSAGIRAGGKKVQAQKT